MLTFFKPREPDTAEKGSKRTLILILILSAVGLLLLVWSNRAGEQSKEEPSGATSGEEELLLYQEHLEARIAALCASVRGVSNVTVMVTLEGGFGSVYATEDKGDGEEYVILGSGSSSSALLLSNRMPTIAGIGIVCTGGGNSDICRELTELIGATFHLPGNRIYICEAK